MRSRSLASSAASALLEPLSSEAVSSSSAVLSPASVTAPSNGRTTPATQKTSQETNMSDINASVAVVVASSSSSEGGGSMPGEGDADDALGVFPRRAKRALMKRWDLVGVWLRGGGERTEGAERVLVLVLSVVGLEVAEEASSRDALAGWDGFMREMRPEDCAHDCITYALTIVFRPCRCTIDTWVAVPRATCAMLARRRCSIDARGADRGDGLELDMGLGGTTNEYR
mmetsp:Transcript_43997/g.71589  ORF Transcript_43997/g.71589 Transcript_43997/m.71589 type:complete len:228 (+) Transcript_43997:1028-1711(+)